MNLGAFAHKSASNPKHTLGGKIAMKKSHVIALAILLALSLLTACDGSRNTPGGSNPGSNNPSSGNNSSSTPPASSQASSGGSGCKEHDFNLDWVQNETNHWQQCKNCDAKSDHDAHTGNPCEICGYISGNIGDGIVIPHDGTSVSGDKYDSGWRENEFTELLPNPASVLPGIKLAGISEDDEKKYEVIYQEVTREQFNDYVEIAKAEGFTEVDIDGTQHYSAKNADGYLVEITHSSSYMEVALRKK